MKKKKKKKKKKGEKKCFFFKKGAVCEGSTENRGLDVAGPQGSAVTVGYVAARAPLLGTPSLADSSDEVINGRTLSFHVMQSLTWQMEKEEK